MHINSKTPVLIFDVFSIGMIMMSWATLAERWITSIPTHTAGVECAKPGWTKVHWTCSKIKPICPFLQPDMFDGAYLNKVSKLGAMILCLLVDIAKCSL